MYRRVIRRLLVAAVGVLVAATTFAHQAKEAVTQVLFNERTGNIEVMHRFLLHDAEHALRRVKGINADLMRSEESRQAFADYAHANFSLRDQDGELLALRSVGHEIEGKFLWVYAEAPARSDITALEISHGALRDIWPDQVNLVNVDRGGQSESALFAAGATSIRVEIPAD